jgi:peptidyl-prolyl cis-trans isomerase B (cyclophilin B)
MRHVVIGVMLGAMLTVPVLAQRATQGRAGGAPAKKSAAAGSVLVVETVKGTIEIETYPQEAPKTVEHILALVNRRFYNGLRIHRVVKGFVVQFGDPQTRDMSRRDRWGSQGSGRPIGVGEFSPKRTHIRGAVAIAHTGDAKAGDSQMYITLAPTPRLNGSYTVFGQVISGMDIVDRLAETDVIRRVTVRAEAPAAP